MKQAVLTSKSWDLNLGCLSQMQDHHTILLADIFNSWNQSCSKLSGQKFQGPKSLSLPLISPFFLPSQAPEEPYSSSGTQFRTSDLVQPLVWRTGKTRPREVKRLTQGHTARQEEARTRTQCLPTWPGCFQWLQGVTGTQAGSWDSQ